MLPLDIYCLLIHYSGMTLKTVAAQLRMPLTRFARESASAWINRRLLEVEGEMLRLALKYGAHTTSEFLRMAKEGTMEDDADTLDDFFKLDALEDERKRLRALRQSV